MIVRRKSSQSDYPELSGGQHYFVIGIEADYYRVLNDRGRFH